MRTDNREVGSKAHKGASKGVDAGAGAGAGVDSTKAPQAEVILTVPFHDLDPLRVVWHGNYLKYFEIARDRLFGDHGVTLYEFFQEHHYLFPIVRTSSKHVHPLRYGDEFVCRATLKEARAKLVVAYEVRLAADDTLCARGRSEQVAVRADDYSLELQIPAALRRAFGVQP